MRPRRAQAALVAAGLILQGVGLVAAGTGVRARPGAPPPTPVNGTPSPFQSELRTPQDGRIRPPIDAATALLVDLGEGKVLFSKAADARRPIASLTKLMTALVVLDRSDPDDLVAIPTAAIYDRGDYGATSTLGLRAGERLTIRDLLYGALLGSANDAARALAIHVAGTEDAFVSLMNDRARALRMRDTRFASSTGLDDRGRSTGNDLARLAEAARSTPIVRRIVGTRLRAIPSPHGRDRMIQNRNVLLWLYPGATGMKTGFTAGAGACLIATASRDGRDLLAVVLGAPADAFSEAAALLSFGFEGFVRRTLVTTGEELGRVTVRGGSVTVGSGGTIEALVPIRDAAIRFQTRVDPRAAYPPAIGQVVGTYRAFAGSVPVGAVPLVVARVPAPQEPAGPWWIRAVAAVAGGVGKAVGALF